MTYPSSGFQNQWGFYVPQSTYEYPNSGGQPPATGQLDPPQSPSGSVTNESATFNFANEITSTQEFLQDVMEIDSAQQGPLAIANVASITIAGVPQAALQVFNFGAIGNV
jgi:hypothetical protein